MHTGAPQEPGLLYLLLLFVALQHRSAHPHLQPIAPLLLQGAAVLQCWVQPVRGLCAHVLHAGCCWEAAPLAEAAAAHCQMFAAWPLSALGRAACTGVLHRHCWAGQEVSVLSLLLMMPKVRHSIHTKMIVREYSG